MGIFNGQHSTGIHVKHMKNTEDVVTEVMPVPDKVYISMSMHIGAPCQPQVAVGDTVQVGQLIGDTDAFMSAPIHSSASGKVVAIDSIMSPNGSRDKTIVIETDKLQTPWEGIQVPEVNDKQSFLAAVRASGLVGLGGAAFPTHVKYNPKNLDEVDTLIINGAECEPYITSDYRTMMEASDDIVDGVKAIMKYLGIKKCVIGIEKNKPKAIDKLTEMLKDSPEITVQGLDTKYPQGAEKVLIYETTGRVTPAGKLPADVGTIVSNITSIAFLAQYLKTGMPLVSKRITVDGSAVGTPKNIIAPIGAKIYEIIEFCGGYKMPPRKILMGGPMMGRAMYDDGISLIKNNNAILAFGEEEAKIPAETPCINCGRCVSVCPIHLMPTSINKAYHHNNVDKLIALDVMLCMECGCCSYVCPAKRQLNLVNKLSKAMVKEASK